MTNIIQQLSKNNDVILRLQKSEITTLPLSQEEFEIPSTNDETLQVETKSHKSSENENNSILVPFIHKENYDENDDLFILSIRKIIQNLRLKVDKFRNQKEEIGENKDYTLDQIIEEHQKNHFEI